MAKRYRCPVCKAVAEIDKGSKKMVIQPVPPKIPEPHRGAFQVAFTFPSHADCEFNKPVDQIRLDRLEPVDSAFAHEGGVSR